MSYLLGAILVVLVLILGVLITFLFCVPPKNLPISPVQESKSLEDMASIMREEHDEKKREERDQELAEYAKSKCKNIPEEIRSTKRQGERLVKAGRDLIPYGISEAEKRLLEEFNS